MVPWHSAQFLQASSSHSTSPLSPVSQLYIRDQDSLHGNPGIVLHNNLTSPGFWFVFIMIGSVWASYGEFTGFRATVALLVAVVLFVLVAVVAVLACHIRRCKFCYKIRTRTEHQHGVCFCNSRSLSAWCGREWRILRQSILLYIACLDSEYLMDYSWSLLKITTTGLYHHRRGVFWPCSMIILTLSHWLTP